MNPDLKIGMDSYIKLSLNKELRDFYFPDDTEMISVKLIYSTKRLRDQKEIVIFRTLVVAKGLAIFEF